MVVKQVLMKITTVFRIALALCGLATCPKYYPQNGKTGEEISPKTKALVSYS